MAVITPFPPSSTVSAMRARLVREGASACSDEELLTLLLGERATLGTARALLERCGGLGRVAAAPLDEVHGDGVSRTAAITLCAAGELSRRAAAAWPRTDWQVRTPADLAERLMAEMGRLEQEELRVVLLNTKNRVTALFTLYVGNLSGTSVRVGEVYRDAVRRHAAAIAVVHNHPSGDPSPSAEDLRITRDLAEAGRLLDIDLLDHLVIGHGRWVSLRAQGVL